MVESQRRQREDTKHSFGKYRAILLFVLKEQLYLGYFNIARETSDCVVLALFKKLKREGYVKKIPESLLCDIANRDRGIDGDPFVQQVPTRFEEGQTKRGDII